LDRDQFIFIIFVESDPKSIRSAETHRIDPNGHVEQVISGTLKFGLFGCVWQQTRCKPSAVHLRRLCTALLPRSSNAIFAGAALDAA
jgi:hypothetical protein